MSAGKLYGVGVGCGDPEQVTIKAIKVINSSDVLMFPGNSKEDSRAYNIVKDYIEKDNRRIEFMPFPMVMNREALEKSHHEISKRVAAYLDEGLNVALMTIGDPTVYSTFSYVNQIIKGKGFSTEIINGVSSINSVAGRLNISLADGKEQIHIIPGSCDLKDTKNLQGTRVYMKSGKRLVELIEELKREQELEGDKLDVMAVSNCGMEDEMVFSNIKEIPLDGRYLMTVIVKTQQ